VTGVLTMTCPKATISEQEVALIRSKQRKEELDKQAKLKQLERQQMEAKGQIIQPKEKEERREELIKESVKEKV